MASDIIKEKEREKGDPPTPQTQTQKEQEEEIEENHSRKAQKSTLALQENPHIRMAHFSMAPLPFTASLFEVGSSSSPSSSNPPPPPPLTAAVTAAVTALMSLPPEIESEILVRLPADSLQRFTSVSKSWYSSIKNPSFTAAYRRRNSLFPQLLLLRHSRDLLTGASAVSASLSSDKFVEKPSLQIPNPEPDSDHLQPRRIELLNSECINGIVCVVVYSGPSDGPETHCDMFLWNPATGERIKLPVSDISGLFSGTPMVPFYAGLGYDKGRDDYKVLRVVYVNSVRAIVELYSLRENCWRQSAFHKEITPNFIWASSRCTFVDGVGYWGAFRRERKDEFFILRFNFATERLGAVRLPTECINGIEMRYHSLWVYKGLLALSVLRFGEFESRFVRHYIWVKERGRKGKPNWVNLFNIDLEGGPRKPVAVLGNGELLLLGQGNGDHVLYDVEKEEVKSVDVCDFDDAIPYVQSIVSLSRLMPRCVVA